MEKPASSPSGIPPIALIGALFFVFGFVTWINAALIPYFKLTCELTDGQSLLVASAFYIAYFFFAMPSAAILKKTGLKNGMMLGLVVMAAGALLFLPASSMRAFWLFLVGLFTIAAGLTVLQTASNPYVVALGPIESAAQRISIMGICNKAAGALAPLLLLSALTKSPDEIDNAKRLLPTLDFGQKEALLQEMSGRLAMPYLSMALGLIGLALFIRYSGLPEIEENEETALESSASKARSIWQLPHLALGAVAIFFAVAVEVIAADTIIGFAESQGYAFADAKFFATTVMLMMIASYIFGTMAIPKLISQKNALIAVSVLGLALSAIVLSASGSAAVWALASLGLANALLWPLIWPLALDGAGRFAKTGSALLIMGIIGGALLPPLYGHMSDLMDPRSAYAILLPCYGFLLFYGLKGHLMGKKE